MFTHLNLGANVKSDSGSLYNFTKVAPLGIFDYPTIMICDNTTTTGKWTTNEKKLSYWARNSWHNWHVKFSTSEPIPLEQCLSKTWPPSVLKVKKFLTQLFGSSYTHYDIAFMHPQRDYKFRSKGILFRCHIYTQNYSNRV